MSQEIKDIKVGDKIRLSKDAPYGPRGGIVIVKKREGNCIYFDWPSSNLQNLYVGVEYCKKINKPGQK